MEKSDTSKDFHKLVKASNKLSYVLSLLVLITYFSFILIIGFAPELFEIYVFNSSITFGIALGLGIIIFSIILTFVYVIISNLYLDKLKEKIRQ